MAYDSRHLRARFERAAVEAGALRPSAATFDALVARYGEAHRHYHDLTHIAACLGWLDRFRDAAERPDEVELALWFHDAIYDPRAKDNELQSARLAREALGALGVERGAVDRIARLVELTETHAPGSGDAALVIDVDLTILAAAPDDFVRFEEQIRSEYAHVPDELFRPGRRRVLQSFLSTPTIYQVPRIREELETRARANLERRIAELSS